ncbi:hypothetical protein PTKIN_Ptkin14bG0173700 [Pterospermum kingtungense]
MSSYITSLTLLNNGLQGKFPVDVFRFPCLQNFMLSYNYVEVNFPESNWSVPLLSLKVSHVSSLGDLPNSIGNLSSLKVLNLSSNLKGLVPAALGNLRSLKELDLSSSNLKGSVPATLGNLSSLKVLDLSSSNLKGSVPATLGNLRTLEILDVSASNLNGSVPASFVNLTRLNYLDLSRNIIHGPILFPSLWCLNLSSSNVIEVPDVLRNLPVLAILDLSYNRMHVIELNLESLESLDLSHNSALTISNNSNVSLVLPNLTDLMLSYCNITQFPNFLTSQDSLTYLDLSNNIIQGRISEQEVKWGRYLLFLDLSNNLLTALEYYPWRNIQSLHLGSNQLEGPFVVPPPSTRYLSVSTNKLVGEIPSSICNLMSMQLLDLSNNSLSGAIPECLNSGDMRLSVLDLSNNKFNGNIPNIFPEVNALQTIQLNNNEFDGPLPNSLVKCHDLEVLNLGNNKINDTFPHWLGSLPQLQVLVLRANYFHGQIMHLENESNFLSLRILDLSHNEFSGFLPTSYFKSFKAMMNLSDVQERYMEVKAGYYQDSVVVTMKGVDIELTRIVTIFATIDMSSNKFNGNIPEIVGKLTSLQVLNFSHNKLTGRIPSSFGDLTALESLDLSSNKLVGEIPMQLMSLNFLEVLNLSQNHHLVGQIPQGNQFNTFLNDSYQGNLGLCGFPLSKRCGLDEPPAPSVSHEDSDSAFGLDWKFVLMGYGCGLVCGFSAGYIMLTLQKPKWLVKRVQRFGNKILRRYH